MQQEVYTHPAITTHSNDDSYLQSFLQDLEDFSFDAFGPDDLFSDVTTGRKKGKRKNGIARHPVPESDVKRLYAKAFENGVNSHSVDTLLSALQPISTPDLTMILIYPKGNPLGASYREINGLHVVANYLHTISVAAPDSLFLIHDTQLYGLDDGSAFIICKYTTSGSKVFDVSVTSSAEHQSVPQGDLSRPRSESGDIAPYMYDLHQDPQLHFETEVWKDVTKPNPVSFVQQEVKYDRYKKRKVNTVGSYVAYKNFSETNILVKKPLSAGQCNSSSSSSVDQPVVASVSTDPSPLSNDRQIVDANATFELTPTTMDIVDVHGIAKFHIDKCNRIYRLECLMSSKTKKTA